MNCLIVNFKQRTLSQTAEIAALEAEVLARAEKIQQVTSPAEQDKAVEAQASLARFIRAVDNSAEAAKKPVNEIRKKIIDWNKEKVRLADEEGNRIGALVAEFQTAEKIRVAAARRVQDETASDLARERDYLLSQAKSITEQDDIREKYADILAKEAPPIEPIRSNGQIIKEDWTISVTDLWLLARAHPSCVKIEPRIMEIKDLLNNGVKVSGVKAEKIIKSGVRIGKEKEAISI